MAAVSPFGLATRTAGIRKESPCRTLPDEPSLEQLRNQAKDLRRAVLAGEPGALAEAAGAGVTLSPFPLHAAQLTVARRYGFPSWAHLKRHVEVIERYSRFPDRIPADGPASLADRFLTPGQPALCGRPAGALGRGTRAARGAS